MFEGIAVHVESLIGVHAFDSAKHADTSIFVFWRHARLHDLLSRYKDLHDLPQWRDTMIFMPSLRVTQHFMTSGKHIDTDDLVKTHKSS